MKNYTLYVNCFLQISIKPLILLWSESGVSPGFTSISSEKFVGPAASGPEGRVVTYSDNAKSYREGHARPFSSSSRDRQTLCPKEDPDPQSMCTF